MIYHLALLTDWIAAQDTGDYRVSTRGASLDDVGYIHCSTADQWRGVRERFYADLPADRLRLLSVDPSGLDVRYEPPAPGVDELFPHLYGPLPLDAVTEVASLPETEDRSDDEQ